MKIEKKFRKAAEFQNVVFSTCAEQKSPVSVKSKCCKSFKKKKGQMCKRCPKLMKVLAKNGYSVA